MVRMFTYGQTYDEWMDPDAIRPLTDLEAMKGLSGPTVPVDQDQFDISIGKKDPSELEGDGPVRGRVESSLRQGLMENAGVAPGRNRREDRVARGENGQKDMFGRTPEDIKKEEATWLAYREEKRAGVRGGERTGDRGTGEREEIEYVIPDTEAKKQKAQGPKKGRDTWGIVERSSWSGGEYGFEADSEQEERDLMRRTAGVYSGRPERGGRGRGGRGGRGDSGRGAQGDRRGDTRGGFDDRRDDRERRPARDRQDGRDDDWSTSSSPNDESTAVEDDFFDSLMSELSDDLDNDSDGSRARGTRHHDSAGPNSRATESKSSGEEDSFFENLMSELGGALDSEPSPSQSQNAKSEQKLDDDDFFSNLEAELSQSLGGNFGGDKEEKKKEDPFGGDDDDDDFFASLQQEMGKALDDSPEAEEGGGDEASADDFFSSLMDDLSDDLADEFDESPAVQEAASTESPLLESHSANEEASSASHHSDLKSLTVPALKDMLRSKGLKVGGKKAELIERLQSA